MGLDEKVGKGTERRRHERCATDDVEATYTTGLFGLVGLGKKEAHVVDLSRSGTLIRTDEKFKPGTAITLTITLEKYQDVIKAHGVVRRSFANPKDGNIYSGVEFGTLDAPLQARLRAMCEYFNSPAYKSIREQKLRDDPLRDFYVK